MKANELVKYDNKQLTRVSNTIAITNKLLALPNRQSLIDFYINNVDFFCLQILIHYKVNDEIFKKLTNQLKYFSDYSIFDILRKYSSINVSNDTTIITSDSITIKDEIISRIPLSICNLKGIKLRNSFYFRVKTEYDAYGINFFDQSGLEHWNNSLLQNITIWQDKNNELGNGRDEFYILDGHHRLEAALFNNYEIDFNINDAPSLSQAMRQCVISNILNSKSFVLDVVKCYDTCPDFFNLKLLIKFHKKFDIETLASSKKIWQNIFSPLVDEHVIDSIAKEHFDYVWED